MKISIDPRESKFIGLVYISFGLVVFLPFNNYLFAIPVVVYGLACLIIPHRLFPSEKETQAKRDQLRQAVSQSSAMPIPWYFSPLVILPCIGLIAYGAFSLILHLT